MRSAITASTCRDPTSRCGSARRTRAARATRSAATSGPPKAVRAWRAGSEPRAHFAERLHARESGGSAAGGELASLVGDAAAPAIARATALLELAAEPRRDQIDKAARAPDPLLRLAAARASAGLSPRDRVLGMARLLEDPLRAVRIEAANALANVSDEELSGSSARRAPPRTRRIPRGARGGVGLARLSREPRGAAPAAGRRGHCRGGLSHRAASRRHVRAGLHGTRGSLRLAAARCGRRGAAPARPRAVPESADLHFALGVLLGRQEQTKPALAELAAAVRLGPESAYFAVRLCGGAERGRADRQGARRAAHRP